MSRAVLAWDRLVAFVLGLVLLALGVLAILWWGGWLAALPREVDLTAVAELPKQQWLPWAAVGLGVLLVLLALRWLAAHLPGQGVGMLNLPGSDETGRLRVNAGAAADAFADVLAEHPAVRRSRATIAVDRGQLVVTLRTTVEPDADLATLARAADQASAELASVLRRDDVTCRVHVRVGRSGSRLPRVQ